MGEKGPLRTMLVLGLLLCLTFMLQEAAGSNGQGEGVWYIGEDRTIVGEDLTVFHDIVVNQSVQLTIIDSTITMAPDVPGTTEFRLEVGASLLVDNSILDLDGFLAKEQTALEFRNGTRLNTTGSFIARSPTFFAYDTQFRNDALDGGEGEGGKDAIFIANGNVNGECQGVSIENYGGHAGISSPGADGGDGGAGIFASNVSVWIDCVISTGGGQSGQGGLSLTGDSEGTGGQGGNSEARMRVRLLENCTVSATASDGGHGARGAPTEGGDAGDGGDGGRGGDVLLEIFGPGVLEIYNCSISSYSGAGGSGGNGGTAEDGNAGDGGDGDIGGDASLRIVGLGNIFIEGTELTAVGGDGSYGGGYGRLESGDGEIGTPGLAGRGGRAIIEIIGAFDLSVEDSTLFAFGGSGYEGGAGYEQGAPGGAGGDAGIHVLVNGTLNVQEAEFRSAGGEGGNGGIALSDIVGNGGDGGDASIEFNRSPDMNFENFTIEIKEGSGGEGNSNIWDGLDGILTFDLDTQDLYMRQGSVNAPLDDLKGDAEGLLFNISFEFEFGIPVLPLGNAQVWSYYPVDVVVTDGAGGPRVGSEVIVIKANTGAIVAEDVTDERGECHFELLAYHYTSQAVNYEGSYLFIVSSPDRMTSKKVRGEVHGPTVIFVIIQGPSHWIEIYFGRPEGGSSLEFDMDRSNLEVFGYAISRDPDPITSVFVRLYPDDDEPSSWPLIRLGASPIPLSELEDPADRWGKYFPPEENSNKWQWFMRFEIVGGDIEYLDDQYSLEVSAGDVYRTFNESIEFWMAIDEGHVLPYLDLTSPVNGSVWSGPSVDISGIANSDIGITRIELSFDNDSWTSITGLENWTYTMSTDVLGEGNHSVRVRAFDGEAYSPEVERWFLVELDDDGGNGPDDGGLSITDTALLAIAILLLAIGVFGLVALRLRKNRPPT